MATEAVPGELPRSASRYRTLRGKSISTPHLLDILRDSDQLEESPMRRMRSSSVHTLRARRAGKSAQDMPPLPSYAFKPKPVDIPPSPTFNIRNDGKIHTNAIQIQESAVGSVHEKCVTEPLLEQPSTPSLRTKSKSKRLVFGKKELENEPLPDTRRLEREVQRSIAEQKKQDIARLQATLGTPPPKPKTFLLSLFSRRKKLPTPTLAHSDTPSSIASTVFTSRGDSFETASNTDGAKFSGSIEKPTPVPIPYPQATPTIYAPLEFECVSAGVPYCPASKSDHDLVIAAVPDSTETPPGFTLQLHQSSRPGKWNKRWITLLKNGKMYSAKTADALPGDAACVQLCHLADFDIYSPKEAEVRQSVRPPKQFCYAIKSQQKSMVFSGEVNFVHYFSTDDEEDATQFYELVHGWRSWHLVSKNLALDRKMNAPAPQLTFDSTNGSDASADESKSGSEPSSATSSNRIGTFQPLLDVDNNSKVAEEASKLLPAEPPTPAPADERHGAHPTPPEIPLPSTPAPKAKEQPVKPSLKRPETDKDFGSPPDPMYHPSPRSLSADCVKSSLQADSTSLGFEAFSFDAPEDKSEPKSWFPSAAEHTAKLRKDEPPPSFRRPATADTALYGSPRRANPQPYNKTHFLGPPRPFDSFGIPPPKLGSNTPLIYKLPGAPMLPSAPRAPPTTNSKSGSVGPASPPNCTRPPHRSMVSSLQGRRQMLENMPPVPPLPNRSMRRDTPPTTPILSVQPRYPPAQRGQALQPFPAA